ncbi:hypothetical protein FB45DRAFT_929560 [Roridomyces roridus]|uniref:Uncharacterized protein n=1 Tax=Roridomyces roridus TaxID=1738132 RepID=A0AAD7FI58_9AGAR|nr:hypothetical protein FB45DRAFT_929560 [Roridomyces roridus]
MATRKDDARIVKKEEEQPANLPAAATTSSSSSHSSQFHPFLHRLGIQDLVENPKRWRAAEHEKTRKNVACIAEGLGALDHDMTRLSCALTGAIQGFQGQVVGLTAQVQDGVSKTELVNAVTNLSNHTHELTAAVGNVYSRVAALEHAVSGPLSRLPALEQEVHSLRATMQAILNERAAAAPPSQLNGNGKRSREVEANELGRNLRPNNCVPTHSPLASSPTTHVVPPPRRQPSYPGHQQQMRPPQARAPPLHSVAHSGPNRPQQHVSYPSEYPLPSNSQYPHQTYSPETLYRNPLNQNQPHPAARGDFYRYE